MRSFLYSDIPRRIILIGLRYSNGEKIILSVNINVASFSNQLCPFLLQH